jgi:hypothetical protein
VGTTKSSGRNAPPAAFRGDLNIVDLSGDTPSGDGACGIEL